MENFPDFKSRSFLKAQIFNSLNFYYPRCVDSTNGGFYNSFRENGSISNDKIKHLVGTTRFTYVFSVGTLLQGPHWCLDMAERGIDYLHNSHWDVVHDGYFNELNGLKVVDASKQVYGHAHVILAAATASRAGLASAIPLISSTFDVLEEHAWSEPYQLYADDFIEDWSHATPKRGQNANMHMCEAMISAYEATHDLKYLERAVLLAEGVANRLASLTDGLIWETYNEDWTPDLSKDTKTRYGVYGYLIGHLTEWSKLLVILSRHYENDWMLPQAEFLFRTAMDKGWDPIHGGLNYIIGINGKVINTNKSWWVAAESIGAAAVLFHKTKNPFYADWYTKLWEHAWTYLVDHLYGAWYSDLNQRNQRTTEIKSPFHKTDYHPISAMFESYQLMNT